MLTSPMRQPSALSRWKTGLRTRRTMRMQRKIPNLRDRDMRGHFGSDLASGVELVSECFGTGCMKSLGNKYGVIYADPPWSFKNYSAKGEGRNAICHYPCLSPKELAALPVVDL